jgi:hypothetical protein
MWVNEYLLESHGETCAQEIIADIDHRYAFSTQFSFFCPQLWVSFRFTVFQLCQHFQDYDVSLMATISHNGQAMIPRHL